MNLAYKWLAHLNGVDDRNNFSEAVKNLLSSDKIVARLRDIIKDDLRQLETKLCGDSPFDNPNWPYLRAYYDGKKSAYSEILTLLRTKENE